jgi:hypothetical protein
MRNLSVINILGSREKPGWKNSQSKSLVSLKMKKEMSLTPLN